MANVTDNQLFNLIAGSEITGESSYDIWKSLGYEGDANDFLEFLKNDEEDIIVVDEELSTESVNPVQNKVITKEINSLAEELKQKNSNSLSANGIAEANIMYFLGELERLTVGFPGTANIGDMIFISFTTGSTSSELSITTDNFIGLHNLLLKVNCYYELIGLWNGEKWIFVQHEVMK